MVDFPTSIKAFSDIVDGTDFMEATDINQAYDEIEALQTFVGALGYAANQTDSLTSVLREYRRGCKVIADTVAQIKVEAGEVVCVDGSGNKKLRRNTSTTTVTWANIDTASESNSKRYYVYAVADAAATTFTVVVSLSAANPTGVTTFKLLGSFYNDSGGNITDVMDDLALIGKTPGVGESYYGATPPGGALLCDGSAYDASNDETLDDLFAVIGNTFGGSDETDFQVPDRRGRTSIGLDNMGQGSADRMTAAAADTLGGSGGTETHTLTIAEMPLHGHPYRISDGTNPTGVGGFVYDEDSLSNQGPFTGTPASNVARYIGGDGGGGAHANDQPWLAENIIIWK